MRYSWKGPGTRVWERDWDSGEQTKTLACPILQMRAVRMGSDPISPVRVNDYMDAMLNFAVGANVACQHVTKCFYFAT